jgi:hypothetical protein
VLLQNKHFTTLTSPELLTAVRAPPPRPSSLLLLFKIYALLEKKVITVKRWLANAAHGTYFEKLHWQKVVVANLDEVSMWTADCSDPWKVKPLIKIFVSP